MWQWVVYSYPQNFYRNFSREIWQTTKILVLKILGYMVQSIIMEIKSVIIVSVRDTAVTNIL